MVKAVATKVGQLTTPCREEALLRFDKLITIVKWSTWEEYFGAKKHIAQTIWGEKTTRIEGEFWCENSPEKNEYLNT